MIEPKLAIKNCYELANNIYKVNIEDSTGISIRFKMIAELIRYQEQQLQAEQQAHNALKEKLKELEWSGGDDSYGFNWCPVCIAAEGKNHDIDCWLAQAIRSEG